MTTTPPPIQKPRPGKPGPKARNKPKVNTTLTLDNIAFLRRQKKEGLKYTDTINDALEAYRIEIEG